ncbi:MAG: DUF4394 domain-containing protein [Gaiellaceae bacterium MAG52_C11]|nr:DUF4394 domain-containing protein [Candidatus Gaiellasilicea maunaloa]
MHRTRLLLLVTALLCAAGLGRAATADAAELFYGVDTQNRLISFGSDTPTAITRVAFTGLPAGEQIVGLDQRPLNKQLVALSSASRLYRIDIATGAATAIGTAPFAPALVGASFGFDFNPTVDRIRVTSEARQDLRLHPDTGATAAVDGVLTYAPADSGAAATPRVVGSAYTNSVAGATTTTLYDIDAGRDFLAIQNPPNAGTLVSVGALGVDAGDNAGFDISSVDGVAYAALQVAPSLSSGLYRINLMTGAATLAGRIGGGTPLRALAAVGTAPADTEPPTLGIATSFSSKVSTLLRSGVTLRATCAESCAITARILLGSRQVGGGRTITTDVAGTTTFRVGFSTAAKRQYARNRTLTLSLVVTARDAAGNTVTRRTILRARR